MTEQIIIAGFGGQGIMLLGKIIATCGLKENKQVTWIPAYGAEVRGGAAYCMVILSDKEIPSPIVEEADTLIALNALALAKFKSKLKPQGLLILNSSLIKEETKASRQKIIKAPLTDLASGLGNLRVANIIALGIYIAYKRIISAQTALAVMREFTPAGKEELFSINQNALEEGLKIK